MAYGGEQQTSVGQPDGSGFGEIDFVVSNGTERCYMQIAYLLADDAVVEREFGAYSSVKDNWPKYVLSLDKFDFSRNGITHMNVRDFLTGRRKLSIEG